MGPEHVEAAFQLEEGRSRTFEVRLDVFEGPFDLLLALIGQRRVDVCDVPIARLTEDYLAHVNVMQEMDLEITTEFLVVAATLLQLKARALLPAVTEEAGDADEEIERDLLIARLLEVRTFQAAGSLIAERLAEGDRRFPAAPAGDDEALRALPSLAGISAPDLARSLVELLSRPVPTVDTSLLVGVEVSAQEASAELAARLARGPVTFAELAWGRSLQWAVALFLAMLELAMRGDVTLGQAERLGEIEIRPVDATRRGEETQP